MWEKVVKNSYSISCYNPNLYPIFTKKFKEKNKLIIPINHDNLYKSGIILPNLIYSYIHFLNLIYSYIQLHKCIQETPIKKIQISNIAYVLCTFLFFFPMGNMRIYYPPPSILHASSPPSLLLCHLLLLIHSQSPFIGTFEPWNGIEIFWIFPSPSRSPSLPLPSLTRSQSLSKGNFEPWNGINKFLGSLPLLFPSLRFLLQLS